MSRQRDRWPGMRVVHVSDCYGPRVGGIEVEVAGLAAAQAAAGHRVDVVTRTRGAGAPDGGAVRVHRLGRGAAPWWDRRVAAALRSACPDAVHVHMSLISPLAVAAAAAAVGASLPTVLTVHSVWDGWSRSAYRAADRLVGWSDRPAVWTTVSEAAATAMRPLLPEAPVVIPNAVDLPFWHAAATVHRAGPGLHVVTVGRLTPRKRPMDVVRVLRDARRRLPASMPVRATMVGDGPERGRLARFLARHGMQGWVTLAGSLDRGAIQRVHAAADVFLAPAVRESFGIAALEARTAGLAVLARAGTGVTDFVRHGREGLLADDRDGLTDALVRLAYDPSLLASITAHNRATLPRDVGWPAVLSRFDACYARARTLAGPITPAAAPADGRPTPLPPARPARSRGRA